MNSTLTCINHEYNYIIELWVPAASVDAFVEVKWITSVMSDTVGVLAVTFVVGPPAEQIIILII